MLNQQQQQLVWVILAVLLAMYHSYIQNPLEKKATAKAFPHAPWLHRPKCASCVGMPSKHAEVAALVAVILVVRAGLPWWLGVLAVIAMAWERVRIKQHTWLQVLVGALLGALYGIGYTSALFPTMVVVVVLGIYLHLWYIRP
jgi:membrane-associated phospholipid phosphatase